MCKITKNKNLYFLIVSSLIISGLYVNRKISIVEKNGSEIHSEIINQYTKIITNKIYYDLPDNFEKIGTHINTYLIMDLIRYPEYKAYYALEDIDKNGVPELFIGGSENNDIYRCYDIFLFEKQILLDYL